MQVSVVTRSFQYSGVLLPDPDPTMRPIEVRDFYAGAGYPELATAEVLESFDVDRQTLEVTFHRAVGTKGFAPATPEGAYQLIEASLQGFHKSTLPQVLPVSLNNAVMALQQADGNTNEGKLVVPSDLLPPIL